ncbi:MAG: glucose-1-phosphate adenylyltransferase subunit GlgD [Clostridia bacterium]|nr:glucose-1-phosphate adenylyltransferase subunit GlgD [Clostridia bacterium]MBQ7048575.1 glucose-1-phosphate adenylyltransferase subunit GlgD [Clostridia bacterium]
MAGVVGIIFSNIHDKNVSELTRRRTMASVPFGCRYRLIDFTLSNLVNSGITHVGVVTHYNYQSLMDHIGTGKDWDLARSSGGIKILPPYITAFANAQNSLYSTRLEAMKSMIEFISSCKEEYVLLSDCDVICNIDLSEMINAHITSGADMTIAVKRMYITHDVRNVEIVESDADGVITDISEANGIVTGYRDINLNITVLHRTYLVNLIMDAVAHGYDSFTKDIVAKNLDNCDYRVYRYDNYFAGINSLTDYYMCNMDLLSSSARDSLFNVKNRPIYTKIRNSSPTVYEEGSSVKNSLIADGCVIHGTVENSILFRGVKVGKNTVIKNSILMQDTLIGENVSLNCVITDKDVVIRDGRTLSGHETKPFYIDKLTVV